jgi:hypothetical protein
MQIHSKEKLSMWQKPTREENSAKLVNKEKEIR